MTYGLWLMALEGWLQACGISNAWKTASLTTPFFFPLLFSLKLYILAQTLNCLRLQFFPHRTFQGGH